MRNIKLIRLTVLLGLAFLLIGAIPAAGANFLKDIRVQKAGDSVVVIISTSQPCQYETMLLSGKPERIVVDLKGIDNAWVKKKFPNLPLISIESIRTSQFQRDPLVARVVLDINRAINFSSDQNENDILIKFPAAADETEFAEWRAQESPSVASAPKTKTSAVPVAKKETPKTSSSGVKLESYPKRKLVTYSTHKLKDPFMSLVGGVTGQIYAELPMIENLSLVGILEDVDGNRALLEDAEGNGYILMPNDKVKNGYLVSVTDTKAIFQITEYGWTRTVALELNLPEIR